MEREKKSDRCLELQLRAVGGGFRFRLEDTNTNVQDGLAKLREDPMTIIRGKMNEGLRDRSYIRREEVSRDSTCGV